MVLMVLLLMIEINRINEPIGPNYAPHHPNANCRNTDNNADIPTQLTVFRQNPIADGHGEGHTKYDAIAMPTTW